MGLKLREVPASQGALWLRQGLLAFGRRPVGYMALFVAYFAAFSLVGALTVVGEWLALASVPMLSLAYMAATRDVLQGRPVRISHLLAVWRTPRPTRRHALVLCASFGALLLAGFALINAAAGAELAEALQPLSKPQRTAADLAEVFTHPAVVRHLNLTMTLMAVISVPYWHALALVHWGRQGALQALFSSLLGLWRTRGAFVLFLVSFLGLSMATAVLIGLVAALLALAIGAGPLVLAIGTAAWLGMSALFYASQWFMFADTFELPTDEPPAELPEPATPPT